MRASMPQLVAKTADEQVLSFHSSSPQRSTITCPHTKCLIKLSRHNMISYSEMRPEVLTILDKRAPQIARRKVELIEQFAWLPNTQPWRCSLVANWDDIYNVYFALDRSVVGLCGPKPIYSLFTHNFAEKMQNNPTWYSPVFSIISSMQWASYYQQTSFKPTALGPIKTKLGKQIYAWKIKVIGKIILHQCFSFAVLINIGLGRVWTTGPHWKINPPQVPGN